LTDGPSGMVWRVAAAAYAASSILASAASKSECCSGCKAKNCRASRPYPGPW
jgi:hypothetical protein